MTFGDWCRVANAALALALAFTACWAAWRSFSSDQRARFLVLAGFGGLIASTGLGALGNPWRWEVSALTVLAAGGLVTTVMFLWKRRRDVE